MKKFLSLIALMLIFTCMFTSCIQIDQGGKDGIDGKDGADGKDGITPTIEISSDGYWVINGVKTEYKAICNCSNDCNCNNNNNDDEGNDNNDHTHNFVEGKCECGETDPNYVPEVTNEYTLGMGLVFGDITNAQINATIATVVLDSNGVIVAAKLDAVQNKFSCTADGVVYSNLLTKKELGFNYNMAAYGFSLVGNATVKEWFEQAAAFEAWCVGKTIAEVAAMETQTMSNGYVISADEALLAAGCTISINDFVAAVVKAGNDEQATTFTTEGEMVLGLGINSADNGSTGDDFEATIKMNIDYAAVVTVDGVIVAALNDAAQPQVVIDGRVVISTAKLISKREFKEDYKMAAYGSDNNGDGIVLEWYLQSAAFSNYIVGKTPAQVAKLETALVNGHYMSTDNVLLSAGCTIQITGIMDVVVEAAIASVKANVTVDVDLSQYADNSLIANYVNSVKKTGAGTFVIEIKTSGNYDSTTPIVLTVVIDANGVIVDAQTISYGAAETPGDGQLADGKFNTHFIGKNETEAGGVDTVAGVTFTTTAYKNAILNAFSVAKILSGEEVDTRTEEEKFADALDAALPAGEGEFTKMFMVEIVEGFDAIYEATNGAGYVCVIGSDSTGTFIGVGADGVAVGEVSAEHKALAEAAVAIVSATTLTDIDVSMYNKSGVATDIRRIFRVINYVQKTATGNYVIEIQCDGHGKKGDPSHEHASGERYTIKVSISADGVIIDSQTISHKETPTWGGPQLEDGAYNSNFIGKNETEAGEVDTVAGTTNTTGGYKEAILRCFSAIEIIEGE